MYQALDSRVNNVKDQSVTMGFNICCEGITDVKEGRKCFI